MAAFQPAERDDERPPYATFEDGPDAAERPAPSGRPVPLKPSEPSRSRPAGRDVLPTAAKAQAKAADVPPLPEPRDPYWTEARIMRLTATILFVLAAVFFVVKASIALPTWLAWVPFLVIAVPLGAFAAFAWRKHFEEEAQSRAARERDARSRLRMTGDPDENGKWA